MTTEQVAAFAKVSLRKLQWWDEHGVLKAGRVGQRRIYSRHDAVMAAMVADLRERNVRFRLIAEATRILGRSLAEDSHDFRKFMFVNVRKGRMRIVSECSAVEMAAKTKGGVLLIEIRRPPK